MSRLWLPRTKHYPIPRLDHGPIGKVDRVIIHINEGSTAGTLNWWAQADHEADGAHLQISNDGTSYQTAALDRKLWHAGFWNDNSIGIEHEGFHFRSRLQWCGYRAQLLVSARRCAWLCHEFGLGKPTHGVNVFGHGEGGVAAGNHPDCPGSGFPWTLYILLARRAYRNNWGR